MDQIPIKVITLDSSSFPGYFLAKAGIKFRNARGMSQLICGFGFNQNKEQAGQSAHFESIEHLYAMYPFQRAIIEQKGAFYGRALRNQTAQKKYCPSSIVIGPFPEEFRGGSDANGLGCHHVYEKAVKHALAEILERHCLACFWYESNKIIEIDNSRKSIGNFDIRNFTLDTFLIPFAISIISNKKEGLWTLGSAFRNSISAAINHAQHEAMMLTESAMIQEGASYSPDIEQRILSLKNKAFSENREDFLMSKVSGRKRLQEDLLFNDIENIAEEIFGWKDEIWIIDLLKSPELNVVKVLCSQAKNPRWYRDKKNEVPYDPFC